MLFQIYKSKVQLLSSTPIFLLHLPYCVVVPFPGINLQCVVSIFTLSLILHSNTHSITFVACSSNFFVHVSVTFSLCKTHIPLDLLFLRKLVAKYYYSPLSYYQITGCAVAQHCYNGDVSFLWEKCKL